MPESFQQRRLGGGELEGLPSLIAGLFLFDGRGCCLRRRCRGSIGSKLRLSRLTNGLADGQAAAARRNTRTRSRGYARAPTGRRGRPTRLATDERVGVVGASANDFRRRRWLAARFGHGALSCGGFRRHWGSHRES